MKILYLTIRSGVGLYRLYREEGEDRKQAFDHSAATLRGVFEREEERRAILKAQQEKT
jgi:hypothetical protein